MNPNLRPRYAKAIEQMKEAFGLDAIISLDYETFYGKGYSLKNRTYAEYIMDPRFKVMMLGVAEDNEPTTILDRHEIEEYLIGLRDRQLAGERLGIIAQNTEFDSDINLWRFGLRFDWYFDAMLISRLRFVNRSAALKAHCECVWPDDPLMRKGTELASAEGVDDYHEAGIYEPMSGYCADDVELTRALVCEHWLSGRVPMNEWLMMHITIRGSVEPQFFIDQPLLDEVLVDDAKDKQDKVAAAIEHLKALGITDVRDKTFASNDQYVALLRDLGVTIPYKLNAKFEMTPALGKTDQEYVQFQIDHPEHQTVFAARETIKSTIATSRATRLKNTANMLPLDGFLPFPLNYHKAHTGRWSGAQKLNMQNLQRGSKHRLCLQAPPGYVIVVRDLSGIEMRMNLWFCEQDDLLELVRDGGDIYCKAAEGIYGHPVNKKEHPLERQVGKVEVLGLGYGMGWCTFQATMAGGPMGMDPIFFPDSFCKQVKNAYDRDNPMIKQMWNFLGKVVIPAMTDPACDLRFGRHGCVHAQHQKIVLPSGRELQYPDLHCHVDEDGKGVWSEYRYDDGTRDRWKNVIWKKLYGGLLLENIIQALARDVIAYHMGLTEQMVQKDEWGWVAGSVHDEVLVLTDREKADQTYDEIGTIMATPPQWCFDLPLASEGGWAENYSK